MLISSRSSISTSRQWLVFSNFERICKMPFDTIRNAFSQKASVWVIAIGERLVGDKTSGMTESKRGTAGGGHSFDKLRGREAEKSDMTAGTALHRKLEPVEIRLQSLVDAPAPLTAAHLDLIREVGLEDAEILSLVSEGPGDQPVTKVDGNRLKNLASLLVQCFRLFGPEGGFHWLHQPLARFGQKSPLGFLASTADFEAVDEYLVQIAEGYFA
jgi:hypothetical protein